MYYHSIMMTNFKSIGNQNNEVILEPCVTTIIGKNESGKSNVLEGLSLISFIKPMDNAFTADNINRNNGTDAVIEFKITLKLTHQEQEELEIHDDTVIIIQKGRYEATGALLEIYNNRIRKSVNKLIETFGQNPFQLRDQDYANYQIYKDAIQSLKSLNIPKINLAWSFFNSKIQQSKETDRNEIEELLSNIKEEWNALISLLPSTFYRNSDKVLKSQYKLEDIEKELKNPAAYPNSLLSNFVKLIGITQDDFILAVKVGGSGQKTSLRRKIDRKVEEKINIDFRKFYDTEHIALNVEFDSNSISFSVHSNDGESLLLSERSNGLKWYLNTFIDAKANGVTNSNMMYLFDEPGVSLHVNAQRELLHLLRVLSSKNNQIVYTTHSPYMLNIKDDGVHRIRAIDKDDSGYTHIYKTAYDSRLSKENQQDTIAPIINAIGMTLVDTFGPSKDKLNMVTEGVSDYIYLSTFAKVLKLDMQKINIVPAVGVSNCLSICNILAGWKCPFIAIFDYDKEGVESGGEKMRLNFLYEMGKQYIYYKDVTQESIIKKVYKSSPFIIENLVGENNIEGYLAKSSISKDGVIQNKTLLSKLLCNEIEEGTFSFDNDSKKRFKMFFERVMSNII